MKRAGEELDDPAKRLKGATQGPGPVLHIRRLPPYCSEQELAQVLSQFAPVVKVFVLPEKNQGFAQFADAQTAAAVLQALEMNATTIRMQSIIAQFSSRRSIDVKGQVDAGLGGATGGGGCILLINVSNVAVPVTLDNIHTVCKVYGEVHKIITFVKGENFQALVQFASPDQAAAAKMMLDGKHMFQGCCLLKVDFSNRPNLVVKSNDSKSRDFTAGAPVQPFGMPQYGMGGVGMGMPGMPGFGLPPQMGAAAGARGFGTSVVLVNKIPVDQNVTPDVLFTLFGVYGTVVRVKILFNKRDVAMVQFRSPDQAAHAVEHLNGCPLMGSNIVVQHSKHVDVKTPRPEEMKDGMDLTKDYSDSPLHRFKDGQTPKTVNNPCAVLHVSNIHDSATEAMLRELFGQQQSNVPPTVEFFKANRKMAYVAMLSVEHAVTALINLHNFSIGPWPIRVAFAKKDPASITNSDGAASGTAPQTE